MTLGFRKKQTETEEQRLQNLKSRMVQYLEELISRAEGPTVPVYTEYYPDQWVLDYMNKKGYSFVQAVGQYGRVMFFTKRSVS